MGWQGWKFRVAGVPRGFLHLSGWQQVPRRLGGWLCHAPPSPNPGVCPSMRACPSVCLCTPCPTPWAARGGIGGVCVCGGASPGPFLTQVFINSRAMETIPNKIVMGDSGGVAVFGVGVVGPSGSFLGGTQNRGGGTAPSVQQPHHGQGSALPAHEGAPQHREDAPGDESGPAGT